jgi:hypothetical protein
VDAWRVESLTKALFFNLYLTSCLYTQWLGCVLFMNLLVFFLTVGFLDRPKIIQTLILPGLAFFNSVPSLHLHMLARRNEPGMALGFSAVLAVLWLASAVLFLVSCGSDSASISLALRQTECPKGHVGVRSGPSPTVWNVVVACSVMSAVLYMMHAGMAGYVRAVVNREEREKRRRGDVELVVANPEEVELARERWAMAGRYEL